MSRLGIDLDAGRLKSVPSGCGRDHIAFDSEPAARAYASLPLIYDRLQLMHETGFALVHAGAA